jgi:hypothetical protein
MLNRLELTYVGPADQMALDFGPRLNILTGDNGLGKTFILDAVWWAHTGTWAGEVIRPHLGKGRSARISCEFAAESQPDLLRSTYDAQSEQWVIDRYYLPRTRGLVVYVRVDGGFSVWDTSRNYHHVVEASEYHRQGRTRALNFSRNEVWDGLHVNGSQTSTIRR